MNVLFAKLSKQYRLSQQEAYDLILAMKEGRFNASQLVATISFFIKRPVSVDELRGFKNALLDLSIPVRLDKEALDVCGTGGDQKNTFNISTLSAFVLAASGIPVAKHGNHGSSSVSGSSDILKYFGYQFKTNSDEINDELNRYDLSFIHAPLFHPTLKLVSVQRKELGIRTFFNLLGPLVNPARVRYKYIGVHSKEVARLYNYVLQGEPAKYSIAHSLDGYDEISLTGSFVTITNEVEKFHEAFDHGFDVLQESDLFGGTTIEQAARIFLNVLKDEATLPQKNAVLVNSAFAMQVYCPERPIAECLDVCKETIGSGRAFQLFKNIIEQN